MADPLVQAPYFEPDLTARLIPCAEAQLRVLEWNIRSKVPKERRDDEPSILAGGGTIFDPWFEEAERHIAADLVKFTPPIHLSQVESTTQLRPLKAFKVAELLFRMNAKESDDINDLRAKYFCEQYRNELASVSIKMTDGARTAGKTGIIRG